MPTQIELARNHRRQQTLIRSRVVADVLAVWNATFDLSNVNESWPETRRMLITLVRNRYPVSVNLAAAYYRRARELAGLTEQFQPVRSPQPPEDQLQSSLSATGIAAFYRAVNGGQSPRLAKNTAAVTVSGSASRLVTSGGRETVGRSIEEDGRALGYIRVTDGDPCHFCAMLASRGPVYKTAATAGDPRSAGKSFHDHCGCSSAPVFTGSDEAWARESDELSDQWARVTSRLSGEAARNAWREFWENRNAA